MASRLVPPRRPSTCSSDHSSRASSSGYVLLTTTPMTPRADELVPLLDGPPPPRASHQPPQRRRRRREVQVALCVSALVDLAWSLLYPWLLDPRVGAHDQSVPWSSVVLNSVRPVSVLACAVSGPTVLERCGPVILGQTILAALVLLYRLNELVQRSSSSSTATSVPTTLDVDLDPVMSIRTVQQQQRRQAQEEGGGRGPDVPPGPGEAARWYDNPITAWYVACFALSLVHYVLFLSLVGIERRRRRRRQDDDLDRRRHGAEASTGTKTATERARARASSGASLSRTALARGGGGGGGGEAEGGEQHVGLDRTRTRSRSRPSMIVEYGSIGGGSGSPSGTKQTWTRVNRGTTGSVRGVDATEWTGIEEVVRIPRTTTAGERTGREVWRARDEWNDARQRLDDDDDEEEDGSGDGGFGYEEDAEDGERDHQENKRAHFSPDDNGCGDEGTGEASDQRAPGAETVLERFAATDENDRADGQVSDDDDDDESAASSSSRFSSSSSGDSDDLIDIPRSGRRRPSSAYRSGGTGVGSDHHGTLRNRTSRASLLSWTSAFRRERDSDTRRTDGDDDGDDDVDEDREMGLGRTRVRNGSIDPPSGRSPTVDRTTNGRALRASRGFGSMRSLAGI
ncbi:hypothetical protein JCM10212_002310 [Sporobolomyces blumeae]